MIIGGNRIKLINGIVNEIPRVIRFSRTRTRATTRDVFAGRGNLVVVGQMSFRSRFARVHLCPHARIKVSFLRSAVINRQRPETRHELATD